MNILQHQDAINCENLQIWNNAAFDAASAGVADGLAARHSWRPLQPISTNLLDPLDQDSGKRNRSPALTKSPASKKSPAPARPLPLRPKSDLRKPSNDPADADADADEGSIDAEIEEIEMEIGRLSARLEALRIKKAEREARTAAATRRGRIVPAKFMDSKDLKTPDMKRVKESPASRRNQQRILGPSRNFEAMALNKIERSPASARQQRRGLSLGPMEIKNSASSTPAQSSRRKSCFWKLEGIQEEEGVSSNPKSRSYIAKAPEQRLGFTADRSKKAAQSPADHASARIQRRGLSLGPSEIPSSTRLGQPGKLQEIKGKGVKDGKSRSLSVRPKSRSRSLAKASDLRRGIVTVGAKKSVQREDGSSTGLKPKVLFQEAKNPVPSKRPLKSMKVRVVPSRYSLASTRGDENGSKRRKWSLPEPGEEEASGADNRHSLSNGEASRNRGSENPMNKVKGEASCSLPSEWSPLSIVKIAELLPKIRTSRRIAESPRDSGCAKRVADLVGRKSYFVEAEGEALDSPCKALIFEEGQQ